MTGQRGRCRDDGSATIYALSVIAVLAAIALAAAAVGGAVVARHRAMAAADLAALAAADALARAGADPCAAAEHIASRHGVDLIRCTTSGLVVDVVIGAPVRGALGFGLVAKMQARAGPGGVAWSGRSHYGREVQLLDLRGLPDDRARAPPAPVRLPASGAELRGDE